MIIIGIESSCDESSIAIVENNDKILSNVVSSQVDVHRKFSGVVPEIASRLHTENINFIFKEALSQANITIRDIDIIGIVNQPGLVGSLMVGASFAKSLFLNIKKPMVTVNHLIAHLYANFLKEDKPEFPYIGLIISGGHTLLLVVKGHNKYKIIGTTLDDAVGEAYDKVAKMLNLDYPGGPAIDNLVKTYTGDYIKFKSGLENDDKNKYNFSYSGLKTGVLNYINKNKEYDIKALLKGFQKAAIEILYKKTTMLANDLNISEICIAGGVAANSYLRELFLNDTKFKIHIPPISLCTDNGAMVASLAYYKALAGNFAPIDFEVFSKPKGGPIAYLQTNL